MFNDAVIFCVSEFEGERVPHLARLSSYSRGDDDDDGGGGGGGGGCKSHDSEQYVLNTLFSKSGQWPHVRININGHRSTLHRSHCQVSVGRPIP